jgi:threonyl-tRNA synthetase
MLIVGEHEASSGTVSVRRHGEGDQGALGVEAFAAQVRAEVAAMLGEQTLNP